jgi:two-component system sensor histidine kinase DctS
MNQEKWKMTIRTRIAIVTSIIVIVSVISASFLMINRVTQAFQAELGNRVMAIAQSLAQSPNILEGLKQPDGWKMIQPIAERVRLVTDVKYVVVINMKKIRYSHPLEDRIGTPFRGGDEGPSLAEQAYLSRAVGVEGPSIRAFVPVMDEEGIKQVGVVIVGILTPTFLKMVNEYRQDLYLFIFIGMIVGLIGAWWLAVRIKKQMLNLEPVEIATLLEQREAVIQSISEGIIAIDSDEKITVMNEQAARMLHISTEDVGKPVAHVIPNSHLPEVIRTEQPQFHQMQTVHDSVILSNRLPIRVEKKLVGAVATLQDRTEFVKLAEELTGVKKFIDALRAQNHEYMNKLHMIAGLIQLQKYEQAVDHILTFTQEQERLTHELTERIKDYSICGLILGKISRAKERGVDLVIAPETHLGKLPNHINSNDLLMVIGNLLENAIDAAASSHGKEKRVDLLLFGNEDGIEIEVSDNGPGMEIQVKQRIFEYGFTTKGRQGQGIGLYLVKEYVEGLGGEISVESIMGRGTRFLILLPIPMVDDPLGGDKS